MAYQRDYYHTATQPPVLTQSKVEQTITKPIAAFEPNTTAPAPIPAPIPSPAPTTFKTTAMPERLDQALDVRHVTPVPA